MNVERLMAASLCSRVWGSPVKLHLSLALLWRTIGKQKGQQADTTVYLDLLVCPVVLGSKGQMKGILETPEGMFHLSLPPVGGENVVLGPVVSIRDQNPAAEPVFLEGLELILVDPEGQIKDLIGNFAQL